MAIGNDKREVGTWDLVKPTTAPSRGRPDAQQNEQQRETNASLRKGQSVPQAPVGKVPIKDEKPAVRVGQQPPPPPTERPTVPEQSPVVGLPEGAGHETTAPSTPAPQQRPSTEAMEQAVRAGKQAFKALSDLAQGGANKVVQQVRTGVLSSQDKFRDALISQFTLSSKPQLQTNNEKAPAKERPPAHVAKDAEGKVRQPGERVNTEKVAEAIVQRSGPFAAQPQSDARRADEQKKKIETDIAAENGLQMLEGGHGVEGVGRAQHNTPEFSKGFHTIAFIDEDDQAAVEGNVGPVSGRAVALDGSSAREMAVRLYFSNKILKTQDDRPSIGRLIAQTTDDVKFSLRIENASRDDIDKMAIDSRRGLYGGLVG